MKSFPRPWNNQVTDLSRVPIITPLSNGTAGPKYFRVVSKKFAGGAQETAVGGLTLGAIFTNATTIATVVAGLFLVIMAINAIGGIFGKDIRKALKKEPRHGKKEKA